MPSVFPAEREQYDRKKEAEKKAQEQKQQQQAVNRPRGIEGFMTEVRLV